MDYNKIMIPEGWTYFTHRTNTANWSESPFDMESIVTNRLTSAITERDIIYDREHFGPNHLNVYTTGKGIPFEIRSLICNLDLLRSIPDDNSLKQIMIKEFYYDRNNFGGERGMRHPSIPKGEELIVIGIGNYDEIFEREANIIWTIPKRFLKYYISELGKNNYKEIELDINNLESRKTK